MKKIKQATALIIAAAIILSINAAVFADTYNAVKPFFLDSSVTDTMEAARQLGIITEDTEKSAVVTRKNLCRLIVRFYRASTGGSGITISDSPFFDCDANEVVFCYENGIIKGIGDVTFAPDYYVKREEVCEIIVNAIKACRGNVIGPEKDYTLNYRDRADMSEEYRDEISYLSSIGIVKGYGGYFYPQSYITYEQAASMLVETYYQLMLSKININGRDLSIGDSEETIITSFGEPDYKINDTKGNMSVWVYKKDLKNFFYIGIRDKQVSEIFSNGSSFSYRGIASGDLVTEVDFGARAKADGNKAYYEDGYGTVEIGAFSGDNKISYVYAASDNKSMRHNINSSTVSYDITLLYDIISAERAKHGLSEFTINKKASTSAKLHSMSMGYWNYSDYINKDGTNPFERLSDKELDYLMASENIAHVGGTLVDVYTQWMNSPGSRSNILTDYMDNIGIGINVSSSDGSAYVTMDFLKLK